jgi:hypothetical protein
MGDRRMAEIKTSEGSLFVYTHWHGSQLPSMAKAAVAAAKGRLGDEGYWTRIVVDQLTKDGRDQETGFGIMLAPNHEDEYNNDKPSVIIYAKTGKVKVIGGDGT